MAAKVRCAFVSLVLVLGSALCAYAQLRPEVTVKPKPRKPPAAKVTPKPAEKPAVKPAPEPAQIIVESSPDAQVYIDDVFKGQTSRQGRLVIESVRPGEHALRVTLEGKRDYEATVTVVAGQVANVAASLADLPGRVAVRTAPGARVFLNDYSRGVAGTTGELVIEPVAPGPYDVRISAPGKRDYRRSITVAAGQEAKVEAALEDLAVTPTGNVARLAKSVSVSATGGCYAGDCPDPRAIIDGDANSIGRFWSGASGSSHGWVELELDQTYLLSHIRVYSQYWPPADYGSEGCIKYQVEVSGAQLRWITVRTSAWACRPMRTYGSYAMEEVVFPAQPAQRIRVTITDSSGPASHIWRTQIAEIEAGDANLPRRSWSR